jgi:cation diffusion facilitator CzcD-associated flavoprotein CzcO
MTGEVAVVGGGLVGFVAHATLLHGGVPAEDVTVFDASGPDPAAAWRVRAAAIRQRRMRSESDGHCSPTAFPGLAVRESLRRGTLLPALQSVADRYRPSVDEFTAPSAPRASSGSAPSTAASSSTATASSGTCSSARGTPG